MLQRFRVERRVAWLAARASDVLTIDQNEVYLTRRLLAGPSAVLAAWLEAAVRPLGELPPGWAEALHAYRCAQPRWLRLL